jgi:hypothetical protein
MAASLIGYFSTMVTAWALLMAVMNHFSSPPMFRQPHPVVAFKHSRAAIEPGKSSGTQWLGATQSPARVAEAASPDRQKEKQAQNRSRRPSPTTRVGQYDNPEIVASSFLGQYRDDSVMEVGRFRSAAHIGQCDWCAPTERNY